MTEVRLSYFRTSGRFCGSGEFRSSSPALPQIWNEVTEHRRRGSLPGLRPGQGRDLIVLIDVDGHTPRLDMPAGIEIDRDATPIEVPIVAPRGRK